MKYKIALALLLFLFIIGCGGQQITGKVVQINESIKIGAVLPLTGNTAWAGERTKNGLDLALEEINLLGGINGKKLEIIYEDDACDKKMALSTARKLFEQDKVSVIIGPVCSSNVLTVAPLAEEMKKIVFSPVASTPKITKAGDYVFRNSISGIIHGEFMAEYAYDILGARNASTLFLNLANGIDYNDAFVKRFTELGGEILTEGSYEYDSADFRSQLLKIKATNPDVVYFAGQGIELAVRQAKELNLETQILSPITVESDKLFEVAGGAADSLLYTAPTFGSNSDFLEKEFSRKFNERYGKYPERVAANAYDALHIIAFTLRKCGEDPTCIKDSLYQLQNYPGVSGLTSFDENGDVQKPLAIKMAMNGSFIFVE